MVSIVTSFDNVSPLTIVLLIKAFFSNTTTTVAKPTNAIAAARKVRLPNHRSKLVLHLDKEIYNGGSLPKLIEGGADWKVGTFNTKKK